MVLPSTYGPDVTNRAPSLPTPDSGGLWCSVQGGFRLHPRKQRSHQSDQPTHNSNEDKCFACSEFHKTPQFHKTPDPIWEKTWLDIMIIDDFI